MNTRLHLIKRTITAIKRMTGASARKNDLSKSTNAPKAVALLTLRPDQRQIRFYERFAELGYDVFVFVDDNDFAAPSSRAVRYVKIDEHRCVSRGYMLLNPVISKKKKVPVSAWEKALFFFCVIENGFDHVWFIEDDVFIPRADLIVSMDVKYPDDDLLCSRTDGVNHDGTLEGWHWWKFIPIDVLPLPWAYSMVCAVRISRSLLDYLDNIIVGNLDKVTRTGISSAVGKGQKKYMFIEYLFSTVALHRGLRIAAPPELSTITFSRSWHPSELNEEHLYHPMKNISEHDDLRSILKRSRKIEIEDEML